MFADIIVDITVEKLDRVFQYRIPQELEDKLSVGMEVLFPFGRGNIEKKGYIVSFSETTNYPLDKIKSLIGIAPKSEAIEGKLVALAAWMKEQYGGTFIQSLKTVIPIKETHGEKVKKIVSIATTKAEAKKRLDFYLEKNQKARARLMAALLDDDGIEQSLLTQKLGISASVIKALQEQGYIKVESKKEYRNPITREIEPEKQITYNEEQKKAIETFAVDFRNGLKNTYLIHGVTGSGKTEVYIEMIQEVVNAGKQAIVLIPEISLTFQTVQRFRRRFGDGVSIMNSKMSKGERFDQMTRAKEGEIDVMIGPRSALFTPFKNLGIIVIDEEHEQTYKSEQVPRFHAREVAIYRGELEEASVVLGSATPSVDAYYHGACGKYKLIELKNRSQNQSLPKVNIVDLKEELKEGNRSIISRKLQELMEDRLQKKEQIILFINRRGFASFVSCRSCGYVEKCPHCDVSLSQHKGGRMVCHYCNFEKKVHTNCPKCGSIHIGGFRAGTQQIEDMIKTIFPQAKTLRMDVDTTKNKGDYERILGAFASEEADILIGTQMIVKGHDFPNVTLMGVLAADLSLFVNDYRSGERTFQILTQAAGRAGRGTKSGEVVIQTYNPDNYSVIAASNQDYTGFYEEEIEYRELLGYPPVEHMLALLMQSENEQLLETGCTYTKKFMEALPCTGNCHIIGPSTPYVGKISDVYRRVIFVKAQNYETLVTMKNKLEQYIEVNHGFKKIRVQFDFNPMNSW